MFEKSIKQNLFLIQNLQTNMFTAQNKIFLKIRREKLTKNYHLLINLLGELNYNSFILDLLLLFFLNPCALIVFWLDDIELDLAYLFIMLVLLNRKWSYFDLLFDFLGLIITPESYYVGILLLDFDFISIDWPVLSLSVLDESTYYVSNRLLLDILKCYVLYLLFREC